MKLYEIANEIRSLLDSADGGELDEKQFQQMETLELSLDSKINSCCGLIREWQAFIEARHNEINRLRDGIDSYERAIERLKDYIQLCLANIGETKHETGLFKCWIQKSPPSAALDGSLPVELLDKKYQRVKYEADSRAAIESWKETGRAPAGFEIRQGIHLRIK